MFREGNLVVHNKRLKRVSWVSDSKKSIEIRCLKTGNYADFYRDEYHLVKHARTLRVPKVIPTLLLLLLAIILVFTYIYLSTNSISLSLLGALIIFYLGVTRRWFIYQSYSY